MGKVSSKHAMGASESTAGDLAVVLVMALQIKRQPLVVGF